MISVRVLTCTSPGSSTVELATEVQARAIRRQRGEGFRGRHVDGGMVDTLRRRPWRCGIRARGNVDVLTERAGAGTKKGVRVLFFGNVLRPLFLLYCPMGNRAFGAAPICYLLALGDEVGQLALFVELAAEIFLAVHARVGGTGDRIAGIGGLNRL